MEDGIRGKLVQPLAYGGVRLGMTVGHDRETKPAIGPGS
jgi:hypothetical protein